MEDKKQLDYKFIAMPTQLTLRLDNNLRIMLMTLIQVSTFEEDKIKKKGQKWDGFFKRSNDELQMETGFKSKNLVIATIDSLYREKLIDVVCAGKSKGDKQKKNRYKVYFDRFIHYEQDSVYDCITDDDLKIKTLDYKSKDYKVSYLDKNDTIVCDKVVVDDGSLSKHYNIDNEENAENKENFENVKNLENQNNNRKKNIKNKLLDNNIKMMIDDFRFISSKDKLNTNLNKIILYINDNEDNLDKEAVESYRNMAFNAAEKQHSKIS